MRYILHEVGIGLQCFHDLRRLQCKLHPCVRLLHRLGAIGCHEAPDQVLPLIEAMYVILAVAVQILVSRQGNLLEFLPGPLTVLIQLVEVAQLNVPTLYVEEELAILADGQNGKYGLFRRMDGGKHALNFILFDRETIEKANNIYIKPLPAICGILADFIEANRKEYLAFPYLNRKVGLNLILWPQIYRITDAFSDNVERILSEKYFPEAEKKLRCPSLHATIKYRKRSLGKTSMNTR